MSFLIDTDICSAYIKGSVLVRSRFSQYGGRLHISIVTEAELKQWLFRRRTPRRYLHEFTGMLPTLTILNLNQAIVQAG
jgi:predicted nucleic acid-binding protein